VLEPACEAEICDDYVAISAKEEIFEIEIMVSNLLLMMCQTDSTDKGLRGFFLRGISVVGYSPPDV
jgi:hypothetical protein